MKRDVPIHSVLASAPKTRGRRLFAIVVASSAFLAATWVIAVHSDFHEHPSVPSSTFGFAVHEPSTK